MSKVREVEEQDLRKPEFRHVRDLSELEFREDGEIVRKDRWENAVRGIADLLGFPSGFEIEDVRHRAMQVKLLLESFAVQTEAKGNRTAYVNLTRQFRQLFPKEEQE